MTLQEGLGSRYQETEAPSAPVALVAVDAAAEVVEEEVAALEVALAPRSSEALVGVAAVCAHRATAVAGVSDILGVFDAPGGCSLPAA